MNDQTLLEQLEQLIPDISDKVLNQFFNRTTAETKKDGSIVTEADLAMQQAITRALEKLAANVYMLSEEMSDQEQLDVINNHPSYWCLDPVDGTNNFHHGVPLFAVSLALIRDKQITLGIIYDPVRKEVFSAVKGSGLRINGQLHTMSGQPENLNKCLASVDFKRLKTAVKSRLCETMPFKSQRNIGTCALEWAWLAAGRTQLLLHGGEKFWDYAAGSLLLAEAQGVSCTDSRQPVFNNSLENRPIIAAVTPSLHRLWFDFLIQDN